MGDDDDDDYQRELQQKIAKSITIARVISNQIQPLYSKHREHNNDKGKEIMKARSRPRLKPRMRQRVVLSELMAERRRPQASEGTSRNRPPKRREGTSRNRLPIPTKATSQTHVPDLPHEVLLEIFSRLPLDAVCRAKTLGKYWKFNLSSPVMKPHPMIMVQSTYSNSDDPKVRKWEGLFGVQITDSSTNLDHWFKFANPPGEKVYIIGACKGILCLCVCATGEYSIYNPATTESLGIPRPPNLVSGSPGPVEEYVKHGFGFSSSGQYKVVMFKGHEATVLTVGTLKWRTYRIKKREAVRRNWNDDWGMEGVHFEGCLHWIGKNTVIVFDLDEYFKEFSLPYNVKLQPEKDEEDDWDADWDADDWADGNDADDGDDGDDRTVAYSVGTLDNHLCVLIRSKEDEGSAEVHTMAAYGVDDWEPRKVIWTGDCNLQTKVLTYGREKQLLVLHREALGVISHDANKIVRVEITKPSGTEKVVEIKTAFPFEPTFLTLYQAGFTILELPAPSGEPYVASDDSDDEVATDFIDYAADDDEDYIDGAADEDFNF